MTRSIRRLVTGMAVVGLLAGPVPVSAQGLMAAQGRATAAPASDEVADVLAELPVAASDVTDTDTSLRSTSTEVTVMSPGVDGSPVVSKLRTDSPAEARELAQLLDAQPGLVAAPTSRLRAFGAVNPEPRGPDQWNIAMVGAPDAWPVTRGRGVVVAVIDSGVDASHPDLAGRVLPEIDLLPDVTVRAVDKDHGTRVASLIAASINAVGMAGVAPAVRILPVAALDASGTGDSSTVARAIIAAADAGATVINLSLGGPDPDPVLDRACVYAYTKGAILVAAAGNSRRFGNRPQYPAASPNVVAVASVDATAAPSDFSNTGPHIDLAAPGQDVLAAIHGARYDRQSGTSFAAPHVAGTLALVAAANPALSAAQIVSVTQLTAQDDASGNGRDDRLGHGVVRSDRAVAASLSMKHSGLPAGSKVRLRKFDASPEPARYRSTATFTVRVRARYPDRVWRADPRPVQVRFQFKRAKTKRYRTVAVVASSPDGTATLERVVTRSGRWRASVLRPTGRWKPSNSDYLKVRR